MGPSGSFTHTMQVFDDQRSCVAGVVRFLLDGLGAGDASLVVIRRDRWPLVASELRSRNVPLVELFVTRRLVVQDAEEVLRLFRRDGRLDWAAFETAAGGLVDAVSPPGGRLRVYGEAVDVLAAEGDLDAAHALEELWNRLGERMSMELFCGYTAASFSHPRTVPALRAICRAHSDVRAASADPLSAFILTASAALNSFD